MCAPVEVVNIGTLVIPVSLNGKIVGLKKGDV